MTLEIRKSKARKSAKALRNSLEPSDEHLSLIKHYPRNKFRHFSIGGYWPIGNEMDVRPLMQALSFDHSLCLPCTPSKGKPLAFRQWSWGEALVEGRYGTKEPASKNEAVLPDVALIPLLAFTPNGDRLGYGGGYYDRTLAALRHATNIFACGVAYAAQETGSLPTDKYDMRLDGVLTEKYFKVFT